MANSENHPTSSKLSKTEQQYLKRFLKLTESIERPALSNILKNKAFIVRRCTVCFPYERLLLAYFLLLCFNILSLRSTSERECVIFFTGRQSTKMNSKVIKNLVDLLKIPDVGMYIPTRKSVYQNRVLTENRV